MCNWYQIPIRNTGKSLYNKKDEEKLSWLIEIQPKVQYKTGSNIFDQKRNAYFFKKRDRRKHIVDFKSAQKLGLETY